MTLPLSLSLPARIDLRDQPRTEDLARTMARLLRPGDVLLLSGPIGAGKTTFARALIRAATGNPEEEVPSPTFTLVQTYSADAGEIWHADLYRLSHPDEVFELGLDTAMIDAICLIEWPDRLGDLAPENALTLDFRAGPHGHDVTLSGTSWEGRLAALAVNG